MKKQLTAVALAMMFAASACASDDGDDAPQAQTGPTTTVAPVRGGTLVIGITSDPGYLNPAITSSGSVHPASEMMFNGLVAWGADGKIVPDLADSWTIEGGGTVYKFTLHQGVKWHDGQDFTSEDVKFSFERALMKVGGHGRTSASVGTANPTITTPDPRTVIFTFPQPYGPLLRQMNVTEAPIISKHQFESCGDPIPVSCPANKAPVGTGPFKLDSYSPTEIKMSRNPNYFKPGLPYLDNLVQRVIPDPGTQVLALESKEIDFLNTVPGPELARVKANNAFTTAAVPRGSGGGNCILTVIFNMKPPDGRPGFFTDLRTRQAVWAATNRQQAFQQIEFGQGKVADAPIHSGIGFAHASGLALPTFDVAKAKTLLDQVGWKDEGKASRVARNVPNVPDGTEFNIDYHGFINTTQVTYGEVLRTQLKEVGIAVTVKGEDNNTLSAAVFADRNFDTSAASYCNGDDPEIGVRRQYDSKQITKTAFSNGAGYSNSEVDALLDQGVHEPDPAKRTPIYRKLQEIAVRDLPYMWMSETLNTRAISTRCTGFNNENTGLFAEAASCKK